MSAEVTGAGVVKLITGTVVAAGSAVGVAAAVLGEVPIPTPADLPTGHTMMDVLALSAIAFIWNQMRLLNKQRQDKEEAKMNPQQQPPQTIPPSNPISDFILKQLEKIAFGVEESSKELTDHRMEFAEFAGETRARLTNLERRNTGEIKRV